ncbi:hypothetical protein [Virgibacillus necropolis]|uniref:Uncharacterized protein n=1 Tax=Virgibacillus necropolis TaxID=163877 RepID=A0A221MGU8_9BACI|nr:hypothetical protein [Virgibacillus necropolis]ASN06842.1 hypothetical protein CFK40_18355 [Virgibacillus necropolis]
MELKQFEIQINQKVDKFRKDTDSINKSDNPGFTEDVKAYETRKLRDALEKEVDDINRQYKHAAEEALVIAKEDAAKSYFSITEIDRKLADHHLDTYVSDVAFSYNDDQKAEAFDRLERNLQYLSPAQLDHLRKSLPKVLQSVSDKDTLKNLRGLNTTLSVLQTPQQEALDEVQAAAERTPDAKFRRLRMSHTAYSDHKDNRSGKTGMGQVE